MKPSASRSDTRASVAAAAVSCVPLVLMVAFVVATLTLVGQQALPGIGVCCVVYLVLAVGALWICDRRQRRWHLLWLVVPAGLLSLLHGFLIEDHLRAVAAARTNVPAHSDSVAPATITGIALVAVGLVTGALALAWCYCVVRVLFL